MAPSLMRSLASCIFESTPAGDSSSSGSKLSPVEREAARMEAIQQYRTLLNNLQSCGLIEQKAVDKWERQVARVGCTSCMHTLAGVTLLRWTFVYRKSDDACEQSERGWNANEGRCLYTPRWPNLQRPSWLRLHEGCESIWEVSEVQHVLLCFSSRTR